MLVEWSLAKLGADDIHLTEIKHSDWVQRSFNHFLLSYQLQGLKSAILNLLAETRKIN